MTREEILSHVDHTLLKPEATWPQIQTLCDEAIANHTASICINTCYVKQAVEYMAGRIPVCCVVGFPLGAMDTASKAFEAKTAIENGAAEVDMVINIGRLKNKEYDAVREDIRAVKQAVGDKVLKVIIETCLLTDEEKEKMCDIVCEAGADYIKTSTGFSTAGANFHDVELMVKGVHGRCKEMCIRDRKQDVLMDGRDIGTVVLPDATVKIFLTASPEARATRRWKEYQEKGVNTPYEEVLADVKQRDYQDTHRAAAPLKQAEDAVLLDTSELDFEQSLAAMKKIIAAKLNG